jgi:hypothetical protein
MRAMAESAGVKFLFLLDSMAAAAKSIGAGAREVQDAVNRPSAYSFVCRTPSYDDEPPSRGNGFRQALFEASLTVPGSADHLSKVVGKVLLPDCEITLSVSYSYRQPVERFVFSSEQQGFVPKG